MLSTVFGAEAVAPCHEQDHGDNIDGNLKQLAQRLQELKNELLAKRVGHAVETMWAAARDPTSTTAGQHASSAASA